MILVALDTYGDQLLVPWHGKLGTLSLWIYTMSGSISMAYFSCIYFPIHMPNIYFHKLLLNIEIAILISIFFF